MNSITLCKYGLNKLLKTIQSLTYISKEVYMCFKTPRKLIYQCQEKLIEKLFSEKSANFPLPKEQLMKLPTWQYFIT